jgi:hypothetical protein
MREAAEYPVGCGIFSRARSRGTGSRAEIARLVAAGDEVLSY